MSIKKPLVLKNNKGVNICYLESSVTSTGGGTYLTRVLDARNYTGADVFVFVIPACMNTNKNIERIERGIRDLKAAVSPLILPFKILVRVGDVHPMYINKHFENMDWDDIKS
ncbi:MAG: hypothetical protein [Caudoviricetes sp.]|nr:MAG: hypothetical protein [Caudoviricetes sp.]